jgi:catechol 2,3-dioxygenase-like lactoylglutathione lyase family enzyme
MFSHVIVGTNDLERARMFYDALMGALGVTPVVMDGNRFF